MFTIKKTTIALALSIGMLSLSGITFMPAATAAPTTFTVNVTTDEVDANAGDGTCETANAGECTLRAAIEEANANVGADTIEFNIPGGGVQTITPQTQLPNINEATVMDGYSQPGSQENTSVWPAPLNTVINIEIDGSTVAQNDGGRGIQVRESENIGSEIHGLSIFNFDQEQLYVSRAQEVVLAGNFIGTDHTGLSTGSTQYFDGLELDSQPDGSTVGGTSPADRNIITSRTSYGPGISIGGTDIDMYGNYIGIGIDGVTDLDSKHMIDFYSGNVTLGGPGIGEGNLLAGGSILLSITGGANVIQGNYFGTDYTGEVNSQITNGAGIAMTYQTNDNLIGGINPGEGNTVRDVQALGISVLTFEMRDPSDHDVVLASLAPSGNAILGNVISDIQIDTVLGFGDSNLGIDLSGTIYYGNPSINGPDAFFNQGPDENDDGDTDPGPNDLMNTPEIKTAVQVDDQLTVSFKLDAADSTNDDYRVEFFANDSSTIFGHGPGQTYLGSTTLQDGNNLQTVLTLPNGLDVTHKSLSTTATAIDSTTFSGFGSTSEFSQNFLIGSATDTDSDTIPDAIENAGPNSGDANDDGIQDSTQPTVSTFVSATSGKYTAFVTSNCSSNAQITSIAEASLDTSDTGFQYPYGLTDFVLNCSRGDTVTIDKYVFTPTTDVTDFSVRKYRPNTHTFEAVDNSTVVSETIGGEHAIHLNYSIQDGDEQDDDGIANGIIVDPVGLAEIYVASQSVTSPTSDTTASGTLANTGNKLSWQTPIIFMELGLILLVLAINPKRRYAKR